MLNGRLAGSRASASNDAVTSKGNEGADDGKDLRRVRDELHELVERHRPTLHTYVSFRMDPALRRREAVSDVVQSALREVLANPGDFTFQGEPAFRAFLHRVVEHKLANKRRHWETLKRSGVPVETPEHIEDLPHGGAQGNPVTPSDAIVEKEEAERLHAAIDELCEDDRRLLTMRRFLDLPVEAIAAEVGLSPSTVRHHLGRIMALLSARLGRGVHRP